MKKYYFISYEWHYRGQESRFANRLVDMHPLQWQSEKQGYSDVVYSLLSWNEIGEEEFKQFDGIIG